MAVSAAARPSFSETSRTLLRETVLDAVGELAAERQWREVSMAEVATRAGVSRQTLYNGFGSRDELAQAYVLREAERFRQAVGGAIAENAPDAQAALRAALELFLTAAQTHPVIRAVTGSEGGDELLALLTTRGGPLVEEVTERLILDLLEHWPTLERREAALVADCLVRLAISHAALPAAPPGETAAALAEILGPYVERLTG